jgi:hypothetical protein
MPIAIQFPRKPESDSDQAIMQLLAPHVPLEKETAALARQLKMEGPIVDEGSLYSMKTDSSLLHHFHASDSLRWCVVPKRNGVDLHEPLDIRDEAKLRGIAEKFLARLSLPDKESSFASVTYGVTEITRERDGAPSSEVTSAYVNFAYAFEGLPVLGPGAKTQVEIGHGGSVVGCYRFWRAISRGTTSLPREKRPVIGWSAAQKIFRADPAFAQLDASAKVVVERARLGYMALPPRDTQGALFPVYEMRGMVSTRTIENSPFVRYVVAIDYSAEDLKKYGVVNRHFGGPCRVL